eukprot:173833-Rhodomonas_salina.1
MAQPAPGTRTEKGSSGVAHRLSAPSLLPSPPHALPAPISPTLHAGCSLAGLLLPRVMACAALISFTSAAAVAREIPSSNRRRGPLPGDSSSASLPAPFPPPPAPIGVLYDAAPAAPAASKLPPPAHAGLV